MLSPISIIVLLAYISLVIELVFFPVPSVASTYQLTVKARPNSKGTQAIGQIGKISRWNGIMKTILLVVPAIINILVFLFPLFLILNPVVNQKIFFIFDGSWISNGLGILLILTGRFITIWSVMEIRKKNRQIHDEFNLQTKGLFDLSRNPGLVGMYLFILGIFLIFPGLGFLIGIFFYLGYMHFKVLLEEDFLTNHYGDSYIQYKEKTRRYL